MLSRHEGDHIWHVVMVVLKMFTMCAGVFFSFSLPLSSVRVVFQETEDRQGEKKVFLTRGAEVGSQCRGARGQAALRVGSRG